MAAGLTIDTRRFIIATAGYTNNRTEPSERGGTDDPAAISSRRPGGPARPLMTAADELLAIAF